MNTNSNHSPQLDLVLMSMRLLCLTSLHASFLERCELGRLIVLLSRLMEMNISHGGRRVEIGVKSSDRRRVEWSGVASVGCTSTDMEQI
jgi:hypothetical protein